MKEESVTQTSNIQWWYIPGRLKKSSFVKNVLVVMSGTAAAQIIGFALSPIISRLFTPSDFGIYGTFISVSTIIAAGITLEYSSAIILPKDKEDAINLFFISCICTCVVGSLLLIFCLLYPDLVNGVMNTSGVWALVLLVLATVIIGINSSCQMWCIRSKAFKTTSASQVIRSLSANGTYIGYGYLKGGAAGLIIGSVLADILASLKLMRVLVPDLLALRRCIRWDRIKQLMKDYRDFPMYAATQNIISASSRGLPVLLLTHSYGIAVAGAYAFAVRILASPMRLVLKSLREVLHQKVCETQHDGGSLMPLYIKTTAGLFALGFLPSLVLFLWSPDLFTWIFGAQWDVAGEFAQSLIVWLFFAFCNLPAVLFAQVIRIQRTILFYELIVLTGRAVVLLLGGLYLSASYTVMLFAIVSAVMNILLIIVVGYAVTKKKGHTGTYV